jgi:DNA (cytosine-5)-methyltransferase 1
MILNKGGVNVALKMLSLFRGIGGIDLAAQWAGIETVAFCEIEPFCQKVLKKHWTGIPIFDDIRTLSKEVLEDAGITGIDIVAGGYPCQPYSYAGQRKGEDDDRALWPYMFDIVSELRANWFIGENVVGHISMGIDAVLSDLESIGYAAQPFVIPAASVGYSDERYRVFTVVHLGSQGLEDRINTGKNKENATTICQGVRPTFVSPVVISRNEWQYKSLLGRGVYGVTNRMDRIRALGNVVKPAQIYPIFAAIAEIERMGTA